jgi:small subunit ribosomal protein S17
MAKAKAPQKETPAGTPQARDIGIDVPLPANACTDRKCPFHGNLPVRGQTLEGVVVSLKMENTAVIEREYLRFIQKYERFEKRTRRMNVHAPPCLSLEVGNRVSVMECRPLAKTVHFVAVRNQGRAA